MQRRFFTRCLPTALAVFLLAPAARGQTLDEVLQSYVGQKRILRHLGENFGGRVKRKDLGKLKPGCDLPAEIREAKYEKNEIRIRMERIGTLVWEGKSRLCGRMWRGSGELRLSAYASDTPADILRAELDTLLQTPDAFLAAHGIAVPAPAASNPLEPILEVNPRAREPGFVSPRALLGVNAVYPESARFYKKPGVVVVRFLVGTDGRIYQPAIVKRVGYGMEEQTLRVLDFWRFEPARKDGQPIAAWITLEMSFNIY